MLFSLASGWTLVTTRPSPRYDMSMAPVGNGSALLFGGSAGPSNPSDFWLFHRNAGWYKGRSEPPPRRSGHAMAMVTDGVVLMFGGEPTGGGTWFGDTWCYKSSAGATGWWSLVSDPPYPLVASGHNPETSPGWLGTSAPRARIHHRMAPLGDGTVMLYGGLPALRRATPAGAKRASDIWLFSLADGWKQLTGGYGFKSDASQPQGRSGHVLVSVGSGVVVMHGQWRARPVSPRPHPSARIPVAAPLPPEPCPPRG